MSESYRIIGCRDSNEWNQILDKFSPEQRDVFYTCEYYKVFEKTSFGKATCFLFEFEENSAVYPFLFNSINDLGYDLDSRYYDIQGVYGYNGVISTSNDSTFRRLFFSNFGNYCQEMNIVAEFTRFHPTINNHLFNLGFTEVLLDRETVVLDLLKSYEEIWNLQYSSNNRNMIRKAVKRNLTVSKIKSFTPQAIEKFTSIYNDAMIEIGADKYYLFNLEFFNAIFHNLVDYLVLFEVHDEENIIQNVAIILIHSNKATYYFAARNNRADNSSNNYLLDEAIKYAKSNGVTTFYLGGGNSSNILDPLLKFKANFSKERASFYIGKKIHNQTIYDEVIKQWANKYQDLVPKYQNQLLRYRKIERD